MTSMSAEPPSSSSTNPEHRAQAATGPFMLTLCRLAAPVSIRPPQSPQLKPFTFFTSRARQPDGSERVYLHMGYFESLTDAERWLQIARGRYPDAIATIAPAADSRLLTDSQVLKMLDTGSVAADQDHVDAGNCDQIALLRPEDTGTRRALKEAVVQGAPVFFAVQLHWSAQPIDLSRVPSPAIFKGHTLYATESRREGRSRYFLRLGFFGDPISAKQVAFQVRSNFASAAVVPVAEQEVTRAREAGTGTSIPYLGQPGGDRGPDSHGAAASPPEPKPSSAVSHRASRSGETLAQTLRRLAAREMWNAPDSLNESGVRHLRIEVQKRTARGRR